MKIKKIVNCVHNNQRKTIGEKKFDYHNDDNIIYTMRKQLDLD